MNEKELQALATIGRSAPIIMGERADYKRGEDYQLGVGDVVVASPTKSGTTLVQQVLNITLLCACECVVVCQWVLKTGRHAHQLQLSRCFDMPW
jgi:hypothetical protein